MTHESLALKLRVLRAERMLTIDQAAKRAGVMPETISDAERGRRRPYLPTLRKLAEGYGVPIKELLAEEASGEPLAAGKANAPQDGAREPLDASTLDAPNPRDLLEQLSEWGVAARFEDCIVLSQLLALDEIENEPGEPLRFKVFCPHLENGETVNPARVQAELLPLFLSKGASALHAALRGDLIAV